MDDKPLIPLYRHPTTLMAVDDNPGFLTTLPFMLPVGYRLITTIDPHNALETLRGAPRPAADDGRGAVHGDLTDADRFDRIAVLLTDYDMPGLNGLELCAALGDDPLKKILHSATLFPEPLEQAVSEGVIDHFIAKTGAGAMDPLRRLIDELEDRWFIDTLDHTRPDPAPSWRRDPHCARLFVELRGRNGFAEHHLYRDGSGALMLTLAGEGRDLLLGDAALPHREGPDELAGGTLESGLPWSLLPLRDPELLRDAVPAGHGIQAGGFR